MDCKEFSNLLDAWIEGTLSDGEADRMQAHAAECGACASLLALRKDCRRLDEDIEVPDSFSSSWRQMIREEAKMEQNQEKSAGKARRIKAWTGWLAAAAALVFIIGGTLTSRGSLPGRTTNAVKAPGVNESAKRASSYDSGAPLASQPSAASGSASNELYDAYLFEDYAVPMMEALEDDFDAEYEETEESAPAKIIRTASFTIKTTVYDDDLARVQALALDMGGRVEYLSSYGDASSGQTRSASLTLRIPAQRLDEFLEGAEQIGTVTAMTQDMEDVSDSYYDTQTRLETQRAKLKRLQEMMSLAEDVADLIDIEDAIADAQYAIDRYTGQIKSYDSRVNDSTVTVSIREIKIIESQEVTLGQRIGFALEDSLHGGLEFLEDAAVFLMAALPWLIVLAAAALVIVLVIRKKNKKTQKGEK